MLGCPGRVEELIPDGLGVIGEPVLGDRDGIAEAGLGGPDVVRKRVPVGSYI